MFPLMIPMLVGAGAGMLTNKKNPLEGALLGAALGAGGGLLAPAAAGAGAAAGGLGGASTAAAGLGASGTSAAGLGLGTSAAGLAPTTAAPSAMSGLLSGIKEYKPVLDAASTGLQVANSFEQPPEPPIQTSPLMQYQGGNQQMNSLLSGMQNEQVQRMQVDQQRRAKRHALL